jgi:large subunit ribosomal protein L13
MKTYMAKTGEIVARWYLVDATDKVVGRMAVKIARILMGKHRVEYTPHVAMGDFVVVINAAKVKVTGSTKLAKREYQTYSGYPGGQRTVPLKEMLAKHPERVVSEAVRRMLPKSKLGTVMFSRLKVYAGGEHQHQAQQPAALEL